MLVEVFAEFHPDSKQYVVFWDNICEALPGVNLLTDGSTVINNARGLDSHYIEPRCIIYQEEMTLTARIGDVTLVPPRSRTPSIPTRADSEISIDVRASAVFSSPPSLAGFSIAGQSDNRTTNSGMHGLDLPIEGEDEDIGEARIEHLNITSINHLSDYKHTGGAGGAMNTEPAMDARSATPTLSAASSHTETASTASSATTNPPHSVDTGNTTADVADPEVAAEIDPVKAASSWAEIFKTLGDLQDQYQLTPEETIKLFTEAREA